MGIDDTIPRNQQHSESESFLQNSVDEDKQIPFELLSGDEGSDKTVMVTFSAQESKANVFLTAVTVVKNMVGAGIVGLPYTISIMGWALSIAMFAAIAVANQYSCALLLKSKNLSRHSTFNSIAYHLYRSKAFRLSLSGINLLSNVGFQVAMMSIFQSATRKILLDFVDSQHEESFWLSSEFIILAMSLVLLPFAFVRKIEGFRIPSFVGVVAICIAIASMTWIFFEEMDDRNWSNDFAMLAFPKSLAGTIAVVPNIMFALNFQANFFSIYKGIKHTSDRRGLLSTGCGIGFTCLLYIAIGTMGYCLFGNGNQGRVEANFLVMLDKTQVSTFLYASIYVGFLICDFLAIPVTFFCSRNNLIAIIKILTLRTQTAQSVKAEFKDTIKEIGSFLPESAQGEQSRKKKAKVLFYVYTLLLAMAITVISIFVQSLEAIFNIVGAIASSSISFIFPFTFYCLLVKKKNKERNINFYLSVGGLILFIPLGILSIVSLYL